jgi:hypothetical protein
MLLSRMNLRRQTSIVKLTQIFSERYDSHPSSIIIVAAEVIISSF